MLQRDLKKVANESIFNPKNPPNEIKFIFEAGNPEYWIIRATELLLERRTLPQCEPLRDELLKDAITLLILTRTHLNAEDKKSDKTRDNTSE